MRIKDLKLYIIYIKYLYMLEMNSEALLVKDLKI